MEDNYIGFYKDHDKWKPFILKDESDQNEWLKFCQNISLHYPNDPNPYYEDYLRFIKRLDL